MNGSRSEASQNPAGGNGSGGRLPRGGGIPPKWVVIVVGLLVAHTVFTLVLVYIATRSKAGGVLPDYYQKAVNWDKSQAELRASEKLGWRLQVVPATTLNAAGQRQVKFYLVDSAGKPVDVAALDITYFHAQHAEEHKRAQLNQREPGCFEALLPAPYAGQWTFDCTAIAGDAKFICQAESFFSNVSQ